MTKQILINSVKINSANTISLPHKEFEKGFNIICGSNEAGKSSMMLFLKNCFHDQLGLMGDIELTMNDEKYLIKVEGNQRTVGKRLKLLAPVDKTLDDILPQIDRSFYQKAFTINLDDIKNIDTELFDIIQDHNAQALREHKNKLEAEIKTYLTDGGKATKEVSKILSEIKKLDKTINELTQKEKEYTEVLNSLKSTEADLANLNKKIENKKLFQSETLIQSEIKTVSEKIDSLRTDFNIKLSDNKQVFFDLNNKTALIVKNIEELNNILNSTLKDKINELIAKIEMNYNLKLSTQAPIQIDVSREFETNLRNLQTEINQQDFQIKELHNQKSLIEQNLNSCNQEIQALIDEIKKLDINNPMKFQEGLTELRDAISGLAEVHDVTPKKDKTLSDIIYILIAISLLGYGIYLHNTCGLTIGIAGGIVLALTIKDFIKPQSSNSATEIYEYVRNEILPKLNKKGNFLQTVTALNTIANTEETKLKDFERNQKELDKKQAELQKLTDEKTEIEHATELATEDFTNLQAKIKVLTTINEKTFSTDIIYEFINDIRELRELLNKQEQESQKKETLELDINTYIKAYTEFLATTNLDTGINKAALSEHTQKVLEIIEENEKCKHEIENLTKTLAELKGKLSDITVVDLSPNQELRDLEADFNNLNITLGTLNGKKKSLEDFEGIIAIQNEKNILKQQLQEIVEETFKKKLALNLIKQAEKQIRETEPNLLNAENLLRLITNSKYTGADYASRTIVSANGEFKNENELSRGTREQLYLAFRLGYAQNYGSDGKNIRLPLIIDDAFVNFDKERLTNVLIALKEFSKTNQVLFFTCHKEYITSLIDTKDINIIDLD